ncbi:GntR family transcriptional regulator [Allosediminivita pacifica]|uniref:DNA-binding GntR family transcriptional regulator n=1 Tax=Allosediminivita pacifica TaxID=1267769 RepID=A0A2T6AY87_9RHOB|nr:GntR family transcriptional regulator [Allosediminivita pacifica]PTX48759.1 DNA-binding GntR family transcriptional regulator [Allosediminivita pacifica]GGB07980.1 hypothetical protein GCM10011324_17710 [Allosediminivita pacifica]
MFDPASPFLGKSDPLQPAQKTSFAEDRLKAAVLFCEIAPGSISTEAQISERFGLGRAAVRVALAKLSSMGLMHPIARAGWKALPVTGALIGDVIASRQRVEPALAEARPDDRTLARLEDLAEMIDALEGQEDAAALTSRRNYEREFLDTLAGGATNALMGHFLGGLWDHSDRILRFLEPEGGMSCRACDARALVTAAAAGAGETLVALRMADIAEFRDFAVAGLMRDRTELGVEGDAASASNNNGRKRPDAGISPDQPREELRGVKSNRGANT